MKNLKNYSKVGSLYVSKELLKFVNNEVLKGTKIKPKNLINIISPLLFYTREQAKKISNSFTNENFIVDFAMRYGNPSIKNQIMKLHDKGCENLVILPLYPQYAAATTATVCDEVYRTLMKMRWQPSLKIIPHYESDPLYIDALVNSLNRKIKDDPEMLTMVNLAVEKCKSLELNNNSFEKSNSGIHSRILI